MKHRSKIVITVSALVLLIVVAIPITKKYEAGVKRTQQVSKQIEINTVDKIAETKRLKDKTIADKKIDDKKVADEKIRIAKLNEGITLKEAIVICDKLKREGDKGGGVLYSGTVLRLKSNETQLIKGSLFYVFEIYNEYASDGNEGVVWHLCISKKTGKAYKHYYSNNTLIIYVTDALAKQQTTTKPVKQAEVYDKAYASKDLIVKSEPNVSSRTLETIKKDITIKVYGGVPVGTDQGNFYGCDQYGWSKIKYNNNDAWVKTYELKFADSYNWAPGVKEDFENKIIKQGYANKKSSIRYKRGDGGPYIPNGEGVLEVFTDVNTGSNPNPVVNVDVKTGWYHG